VTVLDNQKGHNIPDVFSLNFGKILDTKGYVEDERKKKATTSKHSPIPMHFCCALNALKEERPALKVDWLLRGLLSVSSLFDALLTVALALSVG
jgi:hypothetical protein